MDNQIFAPFQPSCPWHLFLLVSRMEMFSVTLSCVTPEDFHIHTLPPHSPPQLCVPFDLIHASSDNAEQSKWAPELLPSKARVLKGRSSEVLRVFCHLFWASRCTSLNSWSVSACLCSSFLHCTPVFILAFYKGLLLDLLKSFVDLFLLCFDHFSHLFAFLSGFTFIH